MILDDEFQPEEQSVSLSDLEIFTKIWTSPRVVFKYLNDNSYDKFLNVLLFFAGVARGFDRVIEKGAGDDLSLWIILSIAIGAGGLLGWITYYIYAALMSWTGGWLKGEGDTSALLRMMAHATIPALVALPLLIPQVAIFGIALFQSDFNETNFGVAADIIYSISLFLEFILGGWSFVLLVIGTSEIQKFSIWKAILNFILPVLVIIVPLLGIVGIVSLFS